MTEAQLTLLLALAEHVKRNVNNSVDYRYWYELIQKVKSEQKQLEREHHK